MNRMFAIIEREMRKFFRSPTLMVTAMIFPLVQLIILGNAFGGKIRDARVAIVDEDHGTAGGAHSWRLSARCRPTCAPSSPCPTPTRCAPAKMCAQGRLEGALIIPPQFSRRFYAGENPQLGMVVDNSDQFMSTSRGRQDAGAGRRRSISPTATAQRITTQARAGDRRALSLHRVHEVPAARRDQRWPCSSRS